MRVYTLFSIWANKSCCVRKMIKLGSKQQCPPLVFPVDKPVSVIFTRIKQKVERFFFFFSPWLKACPHIMSKLEEEKKLSLFGKRKRSSLFFFFLMSAETCEGRRGRIICGKPCTCALEMTYLLLLFFRLKKCLAAK